jgi:hypothetical protein
VSVLRNRRTRKPIVEPDVVAVRSDGVVAVDFAMMDVPPTRATVYRIWRLLADVAVAAKDEFGGPAVFPFGDGLIGVMPHERSGRALARRVVRAVAAGQARDRGSRAVPGSSPTTHITA